MLIKFLCVDLDFLDCMFSNNDPLVKSELKKIQKVTSEVISDVRNAEVACGHAPPLQHFSALFPTRPPKDSTFQRLS